MSVQQLVWDGSSPSRPDPTVYRSPNADDWKEITRQLQVCQAAIYTSGWKLSAGQHMLTGQPFYMDGETIRPAQTDSEQHAEVVGFVLADGQTDLPVTTGGRVTRTDWTPITGLPSLVPGATYFLSHIAGMILTSAPETGFVVELGKAMSEQDFDVKIKPPVRL